MESQTTVVIAISMQTHGHVNVVSIFVLLVCFVDGQNVSAIAGDETTLKVALSNQNVGIITLTQNIVVSHAVFSTAADIGRNLTITSQYENRYILDTTAIPAPFTLQPYVVLTLSNLQVIYRQNFRSNNTNFVTTTANNTIAFTDTVNRVFVCSPQEIRLAAISRAQRSAKYPGQQSVRANGKFCDAGICWNDSVFLNDVALDLNDNLTLVYIQVVIVCDTVDGLQDTVPMSESSTAPAPIAYIIPLAVLVALYIASLIAAWMYLARRRKDDRTFAQSIQVHIPTTPPETSRTIVVPNYILPTNPTLQTLSAENNIVDSAAFLANTSDSLKDEVQKRVGSDVQIIELIGAGGFGKVYKAIWRGKFVAVKIMTQNRHLPKHKILYEVELARKMSHENIVQTLDVHIFESTTRSQASTGYFGDSQTPDQTDEDIPVKQVNFWMIMEYCNQGNLMLYLHRRKGKVPFVRIVNIAISISRGMEYLHYYHIIHGDLKTENVLLASATDEIPNLRVKIGDFGLSRLMSIGQAYINTTNWGTLSYLAPEVLRDGTISPQGDVYAFGMLLWELLTGHIPWQGLKQGHLITKVVQNDERPPIPEDTHPDLVTLMQSCWQRKPSKRPTFTGIRKTLEGTLKHKSQESSSSSSKLEKTPDFHNVYRQRSSMSSEEPDLRAPLPRLSEDRQSP